MKDILLKKYFGITPLFWIAFVAFSIFFVTVPQIDIIFSKLFFNPDRGGFYINDMLWAHIIYKGVYYVTLVMIVGYVVFLVHGYLDKKSLCIEPEKTVLYLLIVLAMGPGLIVNVVFKDNFGRARPAYIEEFGGDRKFTPAFIITDQCRRNCSFSSGHASFGYYFMAFAFIAATARKRRQWLVGGAMLGLFIGLVRVMQGRHFLSDIVMSFFFVYFAAAITHWFMYERKKSCSTSDKALT